MTYIERSASFLVFDLWILTVASDVALLATVIAGLVSGRLGAISGNVPGPSAVEATAVLGTSLVDRLAVVSLNSLIWALASDVSSL